MVVPDENTDVNIDSGTPNSPVVHIGGICRKLNTALGTKITIKEGIDLKIMGK